MPEEENALLIGKLVLEQFALEKQIGTLRDEISLRARTYARIGQLLVSQPEMLLFEGQTVDEKFSGESPVDRKALDVDSAIAELRAAITRQAACKTQLAEMGVDADEAEREKNLRASRALFHPASIRHAAEHGGVDGSDSDGMANRKGKRGRLGFVTSEKKADDKSLTSQAERA